MTGHVQYLNKTSDSSDGGDLVPVAHGPVAANAPNTLDQVRELLYGDALRQHGRSVESVQGALDDLEQRILHRFEEMQASMEALARTMRLEQGADMRKIGKAIGDIGREIAGLGERQDRAADPK